MHLTIVQEDAPRPEDIAALQAGLEEYNEQHAQPIDHRPLHLFLREHDGALMGGLLGETFWEWLHIGVLWVREELRGQGWGSKLLRAAEEEAIRRGCHNAFLDTMSWQALPFYQKHRYSLWGQLDDFPPGHKHHFVQKALAVQAQNMDTEEDSALCFFRALADDSRLRIVGLLAQRERSVDELADALRLRPPTVSHHLAKLAAAGLVSMRAVGTVHLYRLHVEGLTRLRRELLTPERMASAAVDDAAEPWDRAVLRASFEGERLKRIPASRKKRDVVLTWLAGRFDPGRRYSEQQVSEMLGRHHEDFATLRRELVDGGWLERDHGTYWLVGPESNDGGELLRITGEEGVRWRIANRVGRRRSASQ
ncbi:MAG TPA: metalloregulator ArsR/SmtB family transcription factor [Chloroflexota bacterium]|nr:metalloregulator ArsR/SmtB family transcription factor [Chloroflexota bacterium]